MPAVEASVIVPLDADRAFALAHELGALRSAWDPEIAVARPVRGAESDGPGAVRFLKSRDGRRMLLRTATWFPPSASSCEMVKGPALLREYGESWRVEPVAGGCRVTWKIAARVAAPVMAETAGLAIRRTLASSLRRRLAGYEAAARRLAAEG